MAKQTLPSASPGSAVRVESGSRAWHAAFTVLLGSLPRRVALLVARRTPLPYTEIVTTGRGDRRSMLGGETDDAECDVRRC